jgi:hypothetical protein
MRQMQRTFDYRALEANDQAFVKEREVLIREAVKQTAQGIVKIGQWLSEVKERLGHGQWLPWLKGSFGWSQRAAYNFISVYEASKLANFANLEIDVSALYLIAAPATSAPVLQEVIRRAEAGEPMTRAKVKKVLEDYKAHLEVPPPPIARQIVIATGTPTVASNNTFVLTMSDKAERELGEEQRIICNLYRCIEEIAGTTLSPAEMVVLGRKFFCRDLLEFSVSASNWLAAVIAEERKWATKKLG